MKVHNSAASQQRHSRLNPECCNDICPEYAMTSVGGNYLQVGHVLGHINKEDHTEHLVTTREKNWTWETLL